jgi:hypothetical protein
MVRHSADLTGTPNHVNHPRVTRSLVSAVRCALAAMLAIAMVAARPSMMASHARAAMPDGCGMTMTSHPRTSTDHDCSMPAQDACCDDCMCAGPVGSDVREPIVVLVATYAHVATVIEQPTEVVRTRRQPALRLPPPLGPPLLTRS